ncbi:MAG: hypothetical protein HC842_05815 [Cytophagales bacterium]|nr:hypothetical protein [Cytophagales bacterium]
MGWEEVWKAPWTQLGYSLEYVSDLLATSKPWPFGKARWHRMLAHWYNFIFSALVVVPGFLCGLVFFRPLWKSGAILLFVATWAIVITAFVFLGDPRYRTPYDLFFIPLAAYFYQQTYRWWVSRRARSISI